jgi:hypothetical protein
MNISEPFIQRPVATSLLMTWVGFVPSQFLGDLHSRHHRAAGAARLLRRDRDGERHQRKVVETEIKQMSSTSAIEARIVVVRSS